MTSSISAEDVDSINLSHEMTMDESTTTTVEFLRARLLSERSISKATRQRADELAKRVVQLEEQLNIATLQRKQAEKATSEVLAILESHGISDLSEVCDSCSDQESIGRLSKKIGEIETDKVDLIRPTKIKDQESKGLDFGVSSAAIRSLSWKGCSDNPNSCEDAKGLAKPKRHGSFVSTGGLSMKHQLRKSRRQIRQRQTRSSEPKVNEESFLLDSEENIVSPSPGDDSQCITNIPKILERDHEEKKEYSGNSIQNLLEDQRMKGQFGTHENSQRKWEEKFKGNNCNGLETCEHGNHSDITEERDDTRTETSDAVDTNPFIEQGGNAGREQVRVNEATAKEDRNIQSVPRPHHDIQYSKNQQNIKSTRDQSQNTSAEFSFPSQLTVEAKSNGKQKPERSKSTSWRSDSQSSKHQAAEAHSFRTSGSFNKINSSRNGSQEVASHGGHPDSLGSVLDALQRAKLSLNSLASSTGDRAAVRKTKSHTPSVTSGSAMNMPVGYAGLFNVPTSLEFETPVRRNALTYPIADSNPSRYRPNGRQSSNPHLETSAETSIRNPFLDPHMDTRIGLPSSSRHMYPSSIDSMPKRSPDNGFPRTYPGMGLEKSNEDLYAEYSNQTRFDLYRG